MNFQEARKLVDAQVPGGNYLTIRIPDQTFILPHKDGLALLACLNNAEAASRSWGTPEEFQPISYDTIEVRQISLAYYRQVKMAKLLNLTLEEFLAMEQQSSPKPGIP